MRKIKQYLSTQYKYHKNKHFSRINPYIYQEKRYENTFLAHFPKENTMILDHFPTVIYTFWTGNNPMSDKRLKHYQILKNNAGVEVILITPENLDSYVLNDHPLHPDFKYLSLVHKSDYLRCYFMHHYGGGYSDIKACRHSWVSSFQDLKKSNAYLIGYPEIKTGDLAPVGGYIGEDMQHYFSQIIGNGAYICRKNTPFTQEWYTELHNRLDYYSQLLQRNPGNIMGDNPGYPIPWTNILGDIFHPLCLKYMDKILYNPKIKPSVKNYR